LPFREAEEEAINPLITTYEMKVTQGGYMEREKANLEADSL
jgi:hypothetical protein